MRRPRKRTTWELKAAEVPSVLARLATGTAPERAEAAVALGLSIGEYAPRYHAQEALAGALEHDTSPLVRSEAALSLGEHLDRDSPTSIGVLLRVIAIDASARVRQCAAEALGAFRIGPDSMRSEYEHRKQVVDRLLDRVRHDPSRAVRTAAAWGLAAFPAKRLIRPIAGVLPSTAGALHDELTVALGLCGSPLAEAGLLDMLGRRALPFRERVVWSLGTCAGAPGIGALATQLGHPDLPVRQAAAIVLGSMAERRVGNAHRSRLRVLVKVGFEPNWGYPCPCPKAPPNRRAPPSLAVLRTKLVEPFIAALKDPDGWVRECAADALAYLGDRRAATALLPLLHDVHGCAGDVAAYSLGRLGENSVVPHLLALLDAPDAQTRERAIDALGLLRDERAREALFKRIERPAGADDDEARLAHAAAFALAALGDRRLTERMKYALSEVQDGRDQGHWHFVDILAHRGNASAQRLVQLALAHDKD